MQYCDFTYRKLFKIKYHHGNIWSITYMKKTLIKYFNISQDFDGTLSDVLKYVTESSSIYHVICEHCNITDISICMKQKIITFSGFGFYQNINNSLFTAPSSFPPISIDCQDMGSYCNFTPACLNVNMITTKKWLLNGFRMMCHERRDSRLQCGMHRSVQEDI